MFAEEGTTALRAERRDTFAAAVIEHVENLANRVYNIADRLNGVADAAFGPMPESKDGRDGGSCRSVPNGQFGQVFNALETLGAHVALAEQEAERFVHIA